MTLSPFAGLSRTNVAGISSNAGLCSAGGGVAAFTPASIANLFTWYDASDAASITQSGGAVSQWNDKSSNGYHATQPTGAKKPTTNATTMNGLNVLNFNGTASTMIIPAGFYSLTTGNHTIFSAYRMTLSGNGYIFTGINGGNFLGQRIIFNNIVISNFSGGLGAASNVNMTDDVNPRLAILEKTSPNFYGKQGANTGGSAASTDYTMTSAHLGSEADTGSYLAGDLAEIVIYSRALTTAEKNQLGTYFFNKWATPYTAV